MPGQILTSSALIQCPHQGVALLFTSNVQTRAGTFALLENDKHVVLGCKLAVEGSPCLWIEWSAGASKVTVHGQKVLVRSSVGTCKNPSGAVQGVAIIGNTQVKVTAR